MVDVLHHGQKVMPGNVLQSELFARFTDIAQASTLHMSVSSSLWPLTGRNSAAFTTHGHMHTGGETL